MNSSSKVRVVSLFVVVALVLAGCGPKGGGGGGLDITQWFVSPTGKDAPDCHSMLAPCRTISYVLTLAQPMDTIHLLPGTFAEKIVVGSTLTIIGEGPEPSILDGTDLQTDQSMVTIVGCGKCTVTLRNLVVQNGGGQVSGGGITVQDFGMVELTNITVRSNQALMGGGIYIRNAQVSLRQSSLEDNRAMDGGGVFVDTAGTLLANDVEFLGNLASVDHPGPSGNGGGLYNKGSLKLTSLLLVGNEARHGGGGIYNEGTLEGVGLSLRENRAHDGGGILNLGTCTLDTLSLFNNVAADFGGGFLNGLLGNPAVARASLSNVLADGNEGLQGGGIAVVQDPEEGVPMNTAYRFNLVHGTLRKNRATLGAAILNESSSVNVDRTLIQGNYATSGGGLFAWHGGYNILTNVTFAENSAKAGAGIGTQAKWIRLVNVTIANNKGGGLSIGDGKVSGQNLLLAYNTPTNCVGLDVLVISSPGPGFSHGLQLNYPEGLDTIASLSSDNSCHLHGPFDQNDTDPLLGPLAQNGGDTMTYALLPGSPAIDAGNGWTAPMVDQRDAARPLDGDSDGLAEFDIGAFELGLQSMSQNVPGGTPAWQFAEPTNCRQGPGVAYPIVTSFAAGAVAEADGRSEEDGWIHLAQRSCWVSTQTGRMIGDSSGLAALPAPELPEPTAVPTEVVVCANYDNQAACEAHKECLWYVPASTSPFCTSR